MAELKERFPVGSQWDGSHLGPQYAVCTIIGHDGRTAYFTRQADEGEEGPFVIDESNGLFLDRCKPFVEKPQRPAVPELDYTGPDWTKHGYVAGGHLSPDWDRLDPYDLDGNYEHWFSYGVRNGERFFQWKGES